MEIVSIPSIYRRRLLIKSHEVAYWNQRIVVASGLVYRNTTLAADAVHALRLLSTDIILVLDISIMTSPEPINLSLTKDHVIFLFTIREANYLRACLREIATVVYD